MSNQFNDLRALLTRYSRQAPLVTSQDFNSILDFIEWIEENAPNE